MSAYIPNHKTLIGVCLVAIGTLSLSACGGSDPNTPLLAAGNSPSASAPAGPGGGTGSLSGSTTTSQGSGTQGNGTGNGTTGDASGSGTTTGSGTGNNSSGQSGMLSTANMAGGDVAGGVLHTAGSALVGTSDLLQTVSIATDQLGNSLRSTGSSLSSDGLSGFPVVGQSVGTVVSGGDHVLNPLAKVTVLDKTLIGSTNPFSKQLINASVLSAAPANNAVIGAEVLTNNHVLNATITPNSSGTTNVAAVTPVTSVVQSAATTVGAATNNLTGGAATVASGPTTSITLTSAAHTTSAASGLVQPVSALLGGLHH